MRRLLIAVVLAYLLVYLLMLFAVVTTAHACGEGPKPIPPIKAPQLLV